MRLFSKCAAAATATTRLTTHANYMTRRAAHKVAILGGSGQIGQSLSMLLKKNKQISELALYDEPKRNTAGVVSDLSHISCRARVSAHEGVEQLERCLSGASLVLIAAGKRRKPGMTRQDLFNDNARIVANLSHAVGRFAPAALLCIITNPMNSTVPVAAQILRRADVYDPRKLLGVTTLDVVRANTLIADAMRFDVASVNVPVIGGHSSSTMCPVFSQCVPHVSLSQHERDDIISKIQTAGTDIIMLKQGSGSATLSMAYAANRFITALIEALQGVSGVTECAFVQSDVTDCEFFANPLIFGRQGVSYNMGLGNLSTREKELLARIVPRLKQTIEEGNKFGREVSLPKY